MKIQIENMHKLFKISVEKHLRRGMDFEKRLGQSIPVISGHSIHVYSYSIIVVDIPRE